MKENGSRLALVIRKDLSGEMAYERRLEWCKGARKGKSWAMASAQETPLQGWEAGTRCRSDLLDKDIRETLSQWDNAPYTDGDKPVTSLMQTYFSTKFICFVLWQLK